MKFGKYETGVNLAQSYMGEGAEVYRIMFPNGFGASIIRHQASWGHEDGRWELATIRKNEDAKIGWDFCHLAEKDEGHYGWLDEADVVEWLRTIEALPTNARLVGQRLR